MLPSVAACVKNFLVVMLWSLVPNAAAAPALPNAAAGCPVHYDRTMKMNSATHPTLKSSHSSNSTAPLLFGGVWNSCAENCQPRQDIWTAECRMNPEEYMTWGTCEDWQQQKNLQIASSLADGALLRFSPCDLYSLLKGRTLWIIGDSHMKNFYPAVRCFMLDFWDHSIGECAASSNQTLQDLLQQTALYPPRQSSLKDTTPPRCVHLLGGGRICLIQAVRAEQLVSNDSQKPGVLQLLHEALAQPQDIFYIGVGRWYYLSCAYDEAAFSNSLEQLGQFYQSTRSTWPNLLFSVPPQDHSCNAPPGWNNKLSYCPAVSRGNGTLLLGEQVQLAVHAILPRYQVAVVDSYNISMGMHDAHISVKQSFSGIIDCLHMCRPGLPEMDIYLMFDVLKGLISPLTDEQQVAELHEAKPAAACGPVAADFPKPWHHRFVAPAPAKA